MANNYIKIENLKEISTSLKNDADKITDLYNNTIKTALESCQNDLKVSGLNYDDIQAAFGKVFANLSNQLIELTDAMNNKIIPKYEQTASTIAKLFNQDFATEINNYLSIINKD